MRDYFDMNIGKLYCNIYEKEFRNCPQELNFSLMDYINNLFVSNREKDVVEFYKRFNTIEQLINWMQERPNGRTKIYEVDGLKDIVVVIPTVDFEGKFAVNCREDIFRGLHLIFVESGGKGDSYFNGFSNANVGMKKALEYDPKWVIFSNDDMYKIDDVSKLRVQLLNLNNDLIKTVYTNPTEYHSRRILLSVSRYWYKVLIKLVNLSKHTTKALYDRFWLFRETEILLGKYNNKVYYEFVKGSKTYNRNLVHNFLYHIFFKSVFDFIGSGDFAIFSGKYVKEKNGEVYDDVFINEWADYDTSIDLNSNPDNFTVIDYKIGDLIGSTLGVGAVRNLRTIASWIYFNEKNSKKFKKQGIGK